MAALRLELLGGLDLRLASGGPVALPTHKSRLLLAYLALAPPGRAQPRAKLTGLLWSDRAEPQARASLRQELHALRRGLAGLDPPPLAVAADAVALDAAVATVDAVEFERLAGRGDRDSLVRAAALYRGDLLEGVAVADPAFEEWLALERRRFRDLAVAALGRLLALEAGQGAHDAAVATGRRLLALDPVHEEAHRALMRLLAHQGHRNAALRQHELCRAALARELGVEPEAAAERLRRELLQAHRPPLEEADRLPATSVPPPGTGRPAPPRGHPPAPKVEAADRREPPPWTTAEPAAGGEAAADPSPDAAAAGSSAERRQLTVVFVDLVGSTTLASRLDPEELHEVFEAYRDAVAGAVARYEGHVSRLLGDGVLACFGWPRAHEDDAERAVRAALAVVGAVARLRSPGAGTLACRVGIATGLVVATADRAGGSEAAAAIVGEAPHLAARLQAAGAPGTVTVAEPTRRLVGELFALEDLGPRLLKGFAAPVRAWRVVGEGAAEGRFEALRAAGLVPLVGRRDELALLLGRWEQAKEGGARWCCSRARPASASPAWSARCATSSAGSSPSRC